jgi:hypothetical protein
MCSLDVRFTVTCVFDVILDFSTLKMTLKTHSTVKRTSKLHIQNASVIDPYLVHTSCRSISIFLSIVSTDKPDPPESCVVTDVYYDNCIVHFTPPKDDGGTEITKYIIEALDVTVGSQWSACAETGSGGERKTKCVGLEHRHMYRFRACAVNKIGKSNPCEMLGDDILIKDPWGE